MDTSVKYFTSDDAGAPELTGEAGSLIALLDACLLNGYGSVTLSALTQTGGTATATVDTGHGFHDYAVVEIAGATPAEYNGEHRIRVTSANQFTFDVPAGLAGSATGTITAKMAAVADWEKAFSGTNLAAYRSTHQQTTGCYLRVDDTGSSVSGLRKALVRGYSSMTDIDTGTNPFPTTTQQAAGLQWFKSNLESNAARPWVLVVDPRTIYFFANPEGGGATYAGHTFGDIATYRSASDAYACQLTGGPGTQTITGFYGTYWYQASYANIRYLAGTHDQQATPIPVTWFWDTIFSTSVNVGAAGAVYPNPVDNGLWVSPIRIRESTTLARGAERGCYAPLHQRPLATGDVVTGIIGLDGAPMLGMQISPGTSGIHAEVVLSLGDWN